MGAGAAAGTGLNGCKIGEMVIAWIFTLPAAGIVGFVSFKLTTFPDPWGWVASLSAVTILLVWAGRLMMHAENADPQGQPPALTGHRSSIRLIRTARSTVTACQLRG
jgi:hypothetical protein